MPKKAIVAALLLIVGAAAFILVSGGGSTSKATKTSTARPAAAPTATPKAVPAAAPPWYAPYVDASLPMPQFASRRIVFGFVVGNGCTPTWGGQQALAQATTINTRIEQAQAIGGQVIASFGGQAGSELSVSCNKSAELEAAYQSVVSRYGLSMIDLDIEGDKSLDPTVNARRAQAIATLQRAHAAAGKSLSVWLTLAVSPSGLAPSGLATIKQMIAAGVTISGVNVMAFDYGPLGSQTVLNASESALNATAGQMQSVGLSSWSELGATIMAGSTDAPGQVWSISSAQSFYIFARSHHLGRLSIWSLTRDKQCVGTVRQPSDSCSGVAQQPLQFSTVLGGNAGQS